MKRILGIDYGRQRIGVSLSDPLRITAQPFTTLTGLSWKEAAAYFKDLMDTYDIETVVIGLPLLLKGDAGPMAKEVKRFSVYLEKEIAAPIVLWDERLSSVQSKRSLQALGEKTGSNKGRIDKMAAALFLQAFLDKCAADTYPPETGGDS